MAGSWTKFYKIVTPAQSTKGTAATDNQDITGGSYSNFSWYQRLVQGSAARMTKYREYDVMDSDVEVSRALDTIAEEMTGNNPKTNEPLEIDVLINDQDNLDKTALLTVKAALNRWNNIHDWNNRLFALVRTLVKYGDVFFKRPTEQFSQWEFIHPRTVTAAIVDENDVTKIIGWQIKKDTKKVTNKLGNVSFAPAGTNSADVDTIDATEIIHFSLNNDMSDTAPFGESILRSVYKSHKQKELLEDAIIIYRIQRAPERRVFYIDVGKMPPQRVKQYLENIKNEIKQKKVPNVNGGHTEIDSVYNPQSMQEDFFLAQRPDGRGSKVDTLPGGQGLGQLDDLEYFQRKVWRGLRVPASYMIEQQEGGQIWNDGKVGVAYIQELRFALFVVRLQGFVERVLDSEFKRFLRSSQIHVDENFFKVTLPSPSNFGKYKEMEVDSGLLSQYSSADGIQYLSKRFILKRYLGLTDDEILQNERMLREEKGLNKEINPKDYPKIYGEGGEEMGGLGGGMGGLGGVGGEMPAGPEELGGTEGEMSAGGETEGETGGATTPPV